MDQGFHGLIGGLVGLLLRVLPDEGNDLVQLILRSIGQKLRHLFRHQTIHVRIGGQRNLLAQLVYDSTGLICRILHAAQQFQRPIQIVPETLAVGLLDAGGHAVIEIHDALAAVLVVLVGLNGDAGQRGIAVDIVGLPQHAVTGGEAAVEQVQQVDLAAGGGQGVEVQVVDMDVPVMMGSRKTGVQHVHFIELLRAFAAELEPTAHGGIAVDVGVFAFDVAVHRVLAGDVLEHLHQAGVHLTHTAALGAVQDVRLGRAHEALFDQHAFHHVLHLLHGRHRRDVLVVFQLRDDQRRKLLSRFIAFLTAASHKTMGNSVLNFARVKGHDTSVPLLDGNDHDLRAPSIFKYGICGSASDRNRHQPETNNIIWWI